MTNTSAPNPYWLTRWLLLRGLGFVYFVAFAIAVAQGPALIGSRGLLPAARFLEHVAAALGSRSEGFWRLPSVFWLGASDAALFGAAWLGLAAAAAVTLGFANAPLLALLWALYLSTVHVGQIFYGYGWESLLCEAGFLGIFLAPLVRLRAFDHRSPPSLVVIVLYRWLLFRLMLGAGLIKWRGDPCWVELTCLRYHYETQPNPGPLSPLFHRLPLWVHSAGVLFNHLVELVAPFGVFGPRPVRHVAGALVIVFQLTLIASGNLSFLNWLTLVIAFACFDDGAWLRLAPSPLRLRLRARLERAAANEADAWLRARRAVHAALAIGIGCLSLNPIANLLSSRQAMNSSFDPFELVNTYGAFGSIGKQREEIILEGSASNDPNDEAQYREYVLPCKPGPVERRPCWVTPYHYRLDWQMWFLPFDLDRQPVWFVRLADALLRGEPAVLGLFAENPFPNAAPRFVRARVFRYRFTEPDEPGTWRRELVGEYLPPVSLEDEALRSALRSAGF